MTYVRACACMIECTKYLVLMIIYMTKTRRRPTTCRLILFISYVLLNYLHAPPRRAPVNRKCRRATAPRVSEARTLERFGLPELKCSQVVNAGPGKGFGQSMYLDNMFNWVHATVFGICESRIQEEFTRRSIRARKRALEWIPRRSATRR